MMRGRRGIRRAVRRGAVRRRMMPPMMGPIMGPLMRPLARRRMRRMRRWMRPRWWLAGPAMMLLFGSAAYKLRQDDINRIQAETGHEAGELSEEELLDTMRRLGIQKLELDDEDRDAVTRKLG